MRENVTNKFKDVGFITMMVLIITIGLIAMFATIDNTDANDNDTINIEQHQKNQLSTFNIFYKDGTKGTSKASRVIYGQIDDNIYFIGSNNDTLQIIPKIIVEDVKEKSLKISK